MKHYEFILEFIRAIVRPTLAVSSWIATIIFLRYGVEIPDAWWALLGAITTFYFVNRHDEKKLNK